MYIAARISASLSAIAVALAIVLAAPVARAEPTMNLKVDWLRVATDSAKKFGFWRDGKENLTRYNPQFGPLSDAATADSLAVNPAYSGTAHASSLALGEPTTSTPWFGVAPNVSLVARDWGNAKAIVGGDIALTDALRPSHSYRMALTRIRFGSGRFIPFAQLGLGQYRVDTDIVPQHVSDTELAAQVGGGVEVHLVRQKYFALDLAGESCLTQIMRDTREPQNVPLSRMWSSLIATRLRF